VGVTKAEGLEVEAGEGRTADAEDDVCVCVCVCVCVGSLRLGVCEGRAVVEADFEDAFCADVPERGEEVVDEVVGGCMCVRVCGCGCGCGCGCFAIDA
jgi:hypothetical protein